MGEVTLKRVSLNILVHDEINVLYICIYVYEDRVEKTSNINL